MIKVKLTAVILAKNEESMISECLNSVSFADTVLVVDNNSTDDTIAIAKSKGAQILSVDTDDFSVLRTAPLKKITSEYVLYLDADERVSAPLKEEIQRVIQEDSSTAAFKIPRKNFYFGEYAWPKIEYLERLFKRSSLKGWHGEVHETAIIEGITGQLKNQILHYTHRDLSSMVEKTNEWSEIEAKLRFKADHPEITWWRFPRVMWSSFYESYFRQKGYKAGTVGILESIYQAFSIFITYSKLWELQQARKKK